MKSKIKKFIKRCTIFLTVFVICFSCFGFSSAALTNNDNGLFIDYYAKPFLQYKNESGKWVDYDSIEDYTFIQTPDGSADTVVYSWQPTYGNMNVSFDYRLVFRFFLRGDNWQQYDISMNAYFTKALDVSAYDVTNSAFVLNSSDSTSQLFGGGSKTFHNESQSLGSTLGYHFSFRSYDELVNSLDSYEFKDYEDLRHSVYLPFNITTPLSAFVFTITDFSNDLFFAAPSDKEFQDYDKAEQEILDATSTGRMNATSLFGGFGSLATYVSTPIMAVGNIMGEFFSEIDILNTILRFALSLGIFSFLVGMAVSVGSHISKSARSEARNNKK